MLRQFWLTSLCLVAVLARVVIAEPVLATQDPPLPELGEVIVEDPLTSAGLIATSPCPTRNNPTEVGEDGFSVRLTGRCFPTLASSAASLRLVGVMVPDGEVRFDLRVGAGFERARISVYTRAATNFTPSGFFMMSPGEDSVVAAPLLTSTSGRITVPLTGKLVADTWASITVRKQGPLQWLLIDDQPVVSMSGSQTDRNGTEGARINIVVNKLGDPDDGQEVLATLRNLRITALAGSEQARMPSRQQETANFTGVVASSGAPPPPAAGPTVTRPVAPPVAPRPVADPWVGDLKLGYDEGSAVGDGGTVPILEQRTIRGFFSWRDLPVGGTMTVESIVDRDRSRRADATIRQAAGRNSAPLLSIGGLSSGSATWDGSGLTLVIYVNGNEMARAYVNLR